MSLEAYVTTTPEPTERSWMADTLDKQDIALLAGIGCVLLMAFIVLMVSILIHRQRRKEVKFKRFDDQNSEFTLPQTTPNSNQETSLWISTGNNSSRYDKLFETVTIDLPNPPPKSMPDRSQQDTNNYTHDSVLHYAYNPDISRYSQRTDREPSTRLSEPYPHPLREPSTRLSEPYPHPLREPSTRLSEPYPYSSSDQLTRPEISHTPPVDNPPKISHNQMEWTPDEDDYEDEESGYDNDRLCNAFRIADIDDAIYAEPRTA